MPYVRPEVRQRIDSGGIPRNTSELDYAITRLVNGYLAGKDQVIYAELNEAIGALECAKLELYRRLVAPYEERKIVENGDVYSVHP